MAARLVLQRVLGRRGYNTSVSTLNTLNNRRNSTGRLFTPLVASTSHSSSSEEHFRWHQAVGAAAAALTGLSLIQLQKNDVAYLEDGFQPNSVEEIPPGDVIGDDNSVLYRDGDEWTKIIHQCVPAIVAIKVNSPTAFDTERPGASQATGFVIDKERGYILTNRHVVHEGPVIAEAIFGNHEEIALEPLYRDPVHDFGIYKFDPKKLKYMDLQELPLHPECAHVGTDVRVIGNNAGEKLSILSGTIARLDRPAPNTGVCKDFNTFYMQAASGTSGGSSGSPVVDKKGRVVALNAAGKMMTSVSYYLPLDRVVRAVKYLEKGEAVPRGTLETVFSQKPFGELQRLGLQSNRESAARKLNPHATGMLVVQEVVHNSPAYKALCPGDIVLDINDKPIMSFVELEDILDSSVGEVVHVRVARGLKELVVPLEVEDLHAITPSAYAEVGGCTLNDISYHMARHYGVPRNCGVYIAKAGYMLMRAGVMSGSVITEVDGNPTPTLKDFVRIVSELQDRSLVPIRVFNIKNQKLHAKTVMQMDRRWFPARMGSRNSITGTWNLQPFPFVPEVTLPQKTIPPRKTHFPRGTNDVEAKLSPSLVNVRCTIPYPVDNLPGLQYAGTGLVLDAEKGYVLVDRQTLPSALGDISVIFASTIEVPATAVFLHQLYNFAILQYDPKLLSSTPVQSATLSTRTPAAGEKAYLVGLAGSKRTGTHIVSTQSNIGQQHQTSGLHPLAINMDALTLQSVNPSARQDGVVADEKGDVLAFWASFGPKGTPFLGVPTELFTETLALLQQGQVPAMKSLGVRLEYLSLSEARFMGLDDNAAIFLEETAEKRGGRRQAVVVNQAWAGTDAANYLQCGDILIEIDGNMIATSRDVDFAVKNKEEVSVTIMRNGQRHTYKISTMELGGSVKPVGTDRIVHWEGAVLQSTPTLAIWLAGAPDGVYISSCQHGSPAQCSRLQPSTIITHVDDQATPDLDTFLRVVKGKKDGEAVRIRSQSLQGKDWVNTVKLNHQYFPTFDLQLQGNKWIRTELE